MAHFTNTHRHFVQFMLTNVTVTQNDVVTFLDKISGENAVVGLQAIINDINREIGKQFFKIAPATCEVTGEKVLVWVNTKSDELTRTQAALPNVEKEYFHALMQEIVSSDDHMITYARCINITASLMDKLTRENGEQLLLKFIKTGYFVKQKQGVYLGPRLILEFTTYLRANAEDCTCELCSELVFAGQVCQACLKPFHRHCLDKYHQNQHKCPTCKEHWQQ